MLTSSETKRDILICIALVIAIIAIYWQVQEFKFVYYDDDAYVTESAHVMDGFTWQGVKWAFTATESGFWHPLTWLSLMADREIFNYNAGGFHWTNIILHIINTLLIFFIIKTATAAPLRSAFVALLFAIHPLHVESVAWVSQRKDLLSTLFGFACLFGYIQYAAFPNWRRYLLVIIFFILGLMSKPMIVSFPVIMLLLDYWPLKRIGFNQGKISDEQGQAHNRFVSRSFNTLVVEKLPLILLSLAASGMVVFTENKAGALTGLDTLTITERSANAIVSYAKYIIMMFWPSKLAFLYPHPVVIPVAQIIGATIFIALLTGIIVYTRQRKPYLFFGWLWYLIILFPVIGLIQVGPHALADRYTYVSIIGLFIILVWGIVDLSARWRFRPLILWMIGLSAIIGLSLCAWVQVGHWRNSTTLFEHALRVTKGNYLALANLGYFHMNNGAIDKGIAYTREAIKVNPQYGLPYHNLGVGLFAQGYYEESIAHFKKAQSMSCRREDETFRYLGDAYRVTGKNALAIEAYGKALKINSSNLLAKQGLTAALMNKGLKEDDSVK